MEKITVYRYYTFIFGREISARGPRSATLQAIERLDGVALRDTAREVDPALIDEEGFLRDVEGVHRSGRYLH